MLGPIFGGDGETNFALPDLHDRVAVGGQPGMMTGQSLAMTWMIAADGVAGQPAPYPMIGALGLFAGNAPPPGWLAADGSLVPDLPAGRPCSRRSARPSAAMARSTFAAARPERPSRRRRRPGRRRRRSRSASVVEAGPDTPVACLGLQLHRQRLAGPLAPNQGEGGFPAFGRRCWAKSSLSPGRRYPQGWVPAAGQEMLDRGQRGPVRNRSAPPSAATARPASRCRTCAHAWSSVWGRSECGDPPVPSSRRKPGSR